MARVAFKVAGVKPADYASRPDLHGEFWEAVVRLVLTVKDAELARGIDRKGAKLASLAASTIAHRHSDMGPADPGAPPLIPAHGLSRTRSLLTGKGFPQQDCAIFWWKDDPISGGSWGDVLAIHRAGGPHLPQRDVIGLSPDGVSEVRKRAGAWWEKRKLGPVALPKVELEVLPTPRPTFLVATPPKYRPKVPENAVATRNRRIGEIEINGHHYTLQGGSTAQIRRSIANGSFSGFRDPRQLVGLGLDRSQGPGPTRADRAPRARIGPGARRVTRPKPAPNQAPPAVRPPAIAPSPPPPPPPATPIDRAVAYAQARAIRVEPAGYADLEARHGAATAARIRASYDDVDRTIRINERHPYWADPARLMQPQDPAHPYFSTAEEDHIIVHEASHALHHRDVGTPTWDVLKRTRFKPAQQALVEREVGRYAATQPIEFVAEVRAGLSAGKVYNKEVMELYRKLRGPAP